MVLNEFSLSVSFRSLLTNFFFDSLSNAASQIENLLSEREKKVTNTSIYDAISPIHTFVTWFSYCVFL